MRLMEEIVTENLMYNATNRPSEMEKYKLVDFISTNLGEKAENKDFIRRAIDYATKDRLSFGGFAIVVKSHDEIVGAAIVNHTGMEGYMAENVLVYIAVCSKFRRKGVAKGMIENVLRYAKGDVALHLKGDSSLSAVCEKFGFKKSIVEMRLERK